MNCSRTTGLVWPRSLSYSEAPAIQRSLEVYNQYLQRSRQRHEGHRPLNARHLVRMPLQMEGKVFAVTGAASGIGRATVIRLSELGAQGIAICDVDEDGIRETACLCKNTVLLDLFTRQTMADQQR